jgi:transcriptional regulator with XRE-family HTH domain
MRFAERLRELREAAGLTQAALAHAAGISLGAVRNYEQGIREPYWHVAFRLAAALGVGCDAFADCAGAKLPAAGAKTRPHAPSGRTAATRGKHSRKAKGRQT